MPTAHAGRPVRRPRKREKLTLPDDLKVRVANEAKARGLRRATFMRHAIEIAVGTSTKMPSRKPRAETDRLAHQMNILAVQVKKLGTNVNQLAKQANTGMVPITQDEIRYVLNQHQLLMSVVRASFEKVLA